MTQAPLYWLRQIQEEVFIKVNASSSSYIPPFPWSELEKKLQTALAVESLSITPTFYETLPPENAIDPFSSNSRSFSFELMPLQGFATISISPESLEILTPLLLGQVKGLDPQFQEGFYHYLILQACKEIQELDPYPGLQIRLCEETKKIDSGASFLDLLLKIQEKTLPLRLVVSSDLAKAFSSYFKKKPLDLMTLPATASLQVPLRLEAGSCLLSQPEWNSIKPGDFLVLDQCTYNPETQKGNLNLVWEEKPLFRVKVRKNRIKILDYAVYNGELTAMNEEFPEEFLEEEIPLPEQETNEHELEQVEESQKPETIASKEPQEILASMDQIPFPVVVEAGRFKMSLEKLLTLQPGAVLELPVHPEQGVFLSVHGKKVAKGELIKIGDLLGVKILEVGGQ